MTSLEPTGTSTAMDDGGLGMIIEQWTPDLQCGV